MMIAYAIIFLWAAWCVFSREVKDGVFGRLMYAVVSVSAMAAIMEDAPPTIERVHMVIMLMVAGIGTRHFVLKKLKSRRRFNEPRH